MTLQFQTFRKRCVGASTGGQKDTCLLACERCSGEKHAILDVPAAAAAIPAIAAIAAEPGQSPNLAELPAPQPSGTHRKDNHHDERSAGLSRLWDLREGWQGRRWDPKYLQATPIAVLRASRSRYLPKNCDFHCRSLLAVRCSPPWCSILIELRLVTYCNFRSFSPFLFFAFINGVWTPFLFKGVYFELFYSLGYCNVTLWN